MTWLAVLEIVLRLFGPVLAEWLRKLLDDSAREMKFGPSKSGVVFRDDLAQWFDAARGRVWWFQFRKRAALKIAERAVLARSHEIHRSASEGGYVTPLTAAEKAELSAAQK